MRGKYKWAQARAFRLQLEMGSRPRLYLESLNLAQEDLKCSKLGVDSGLSLAAGGITADLAADHKPLIDSELVSDFWTRSSCSCNSRAD